MAAKNLAETLAEDLAGLGLAELVGPGSLKSVEGNTLVELTQDEDTIGIYENGDLLREVSLSDEQFQKSFMETLATSLNF